MTQTAATFGAGFGHSSRSCGRPSVIAYSPRCPLLPSSSTLTNAPCAAAFNRGELPGIRVGSSIRIPVAELLRLAGLNDDDTSPEAPCP